MDHLFEYSNLILAALVGGFIGYFFNEIKSKLDRQRKRDSETFEALESILNRNRMISYIHEKDMMGPHQNSIHGTMDEFHEFCSDPRNVFINRKLKKDQLQLERSVNEFNHYLALNSSPISSNGEISKVFSRHGMHLDMSQGFPSDEFKEMSRKLDGMVNEIWEYYTRLITHAKKVL